MLRLWINTLLRLASGMYFVLTSLYCLLAFLPYTYCAFIKAPPYPWMPWFAHHQAALYWVAAIAIVIADGEWWNGLSGKWAPSSLLKFGVLATVGIFLIFRPFLPAIQSNRSAYWWSLASLAPVIGLAWWRSKAPDTQVETETTGKSRTYLLGYSSGLLVAVTVSVIYTVGARLRMYNESHTLGLHAADAEIAVWSVVSHLAVGMVVLSILNLAFHLAEKTSRPQTMRRWLLGGLIVAVLSFVHARFFNDAMSFDGWAAHVYAGTLALALTLWGFSLVLPFTEGRQHDDAQKRVSRGQELATWAIVALLVVLALASRSLIGGEDWNGFVGSSWALMVWIAMAVCVYRLRPARAGYSAAAIAGIFLASAFVYQGLRTTQIFWAKPLGATDDEISLTLEAYGERDASFQLAHHALGNGRSQVCGDLCRILREFTNIRDTHIRQGVQLAPTLTPTKGEHPNIFIFVIDSMRPDYLGAYNPEHVQYTPNLDALARDSVVFRNTYAQYAGTSLSEPAIWSGALLLHTHFPQPFDAVNSLRTLARTDGYRLVASYDTVVQQLFSPSDGLTKLDVDKERWNQYEACSTVQQLESTLDAQQDKTQPVLFYAQPMNVHQFARNDVPSPSSQHWQAPAGMNSRITYEVHWVDSCLGGFFGYLKQRGLYDNSIIVIASDHGDATGEFGRFSHSTLIWPEVMHVPLIIHVPEKMRAGLVYDDNRLSSLTDIAPTLYYLLGHRPIRQNPLYGRPLLAESKRELDMYPQRDLLLASDVRAVYGILTADGRYLYTTYDSPAQSYLFDLRMDRNAEHSILTPPLKQRYDEEIIEQLHMIGDYYGYKPGIGSLLASAGKR